MSLASVLLAGRGHPYAGEDFVDGLGPRACAIGDADSAIAVAGERQAGKFLAEEFDSLQAFEVADRILRHGRFPFVDAREERLSIERDDLPQFGADDL